MQAAPATLDAQGTCQVQLMVECMQPFSGAPSLEINFVESGTTYAYSIPVPVVLLKFFEPVPMDAQTFAVRWSSLGAPNLEAQEVFGCSAGVDPASTLHRLSTAARLTIVGDQAHAQLNVVHGAASLRTGTVGAAGAKVAVGCLFTVEINAAQQMVRLSVRCTVPSATAKVLAAIKAELVTM